MLFYGISQKAFAFLSIEIIYATPDKTFSCLVLEAIAELWFQAKEIFNIFMSCHVLLMNLLG